MLIENASLSLSEVIQVGSILIGIGVIYGKITALTKQVEKHNKVVERVYKLEDNISDYDIGALAQRVKDIDHRVSRIEKASEKGCNNVCVNNHKIT